MYFIANNENYIVAASKDFLEQCGSRDLCAIASSLKDGVFHLERETNSFVAKNFEDFEYSTSDLYSSFGTLTLYSISKKEEQIDTSTAEDANITYLKQLKEGKIAASDNEFSIPTIETLQKQSTTEEATERRDKVIESDQKSIEVIENTESKEVEETKEEESSFETIRLFSNTSAEKSSDEEKETIKLFNYDSESSEDKVAESHQMKQEVNEEKIALEEKTITLEEEKEEPQEKEIGHDRDLDKLISLSDSKPLDETQLLIEEHENDKIVTEKVVNIPTTIESEIKEDKEPKEKRAIDKIKEKLFPWGSRNTENIELEESAILKPASDLVEEKKEELTTTKEELLESVGDKESTDTIDTINIIEKSEEAVDVISHEDDKEKLADTIKTYETKEDVVIHKEIADVPTIEEEKEDLTLEEQELAELKAMHESKNTIAQTTTEVSVSKDESTTEKSEEALNKDNSQLYYKIIEMQVKGIDLERNAQNLNVDIDSYKMLVDNYLDELENYNDDLKNRVHSTITMLADAGELLSLNVVSKKLNEIAVTTEPATPLRDLTLLVSLLRDKVGNKKSTVVADKIEPVEAPAVKSPEKVALKENENELGFNLVEITTPEELLAKIPAVTIDYDPHKASDELNLPVSLILEFADDFTAQAKEHLYQMVKAYKEGDLKTLQTTAHMLKGAASNLRIDPLAENLFTIQKLQSLSSAEKLLKEFVAKLKGLENKLKIIEGNHNEN